MNRSMPTSPSLPVRIIRVFEDTKPRGAEEPKNELIVCFWRGPLDGPRPRRTWWECGYGDDALSENLLVLRRGHRPRELIPL